MANVDVPLSRLRFGETQRRDAWWVQPLVNVVLISIGFGYLTWGLFQPDNYWAPPYLTPLASPLVFGEGPHSWFGPDKPAWWPAAIPLLPGLFIGVFPAVFRMTCYYYRGTYYKAFWADPPNCAVGEPRTEYRGEQKFPLIIQNIHRYGLYCGLALIAFLTYDTIMATQFPIAPGASETTFGIGLGTLIMAANVTAAALYTFGCHSFRHIVGGFRDVFSSAPVSKRAWDCVTCLNNRHGMYAMMSLYTMVMTDVYIRLVAAGIISDPRLF